MRSSAFPSRVRLLDVTEMSEPRADAHFEREDAAHTQGGTDCSHYCMPFMRHWNLLLQHALCNGESFSFEGGVCPQAQPGGEGAAVAFARERYSTAAPEGVCPGKRLPLPQ